MRKLMALLSLLFFAGGCMFFLQSYENEVAKFSCKIPESFFIKDNNDNRYITVFESGDGEIKITVTNKQRKTDILFSDKTLKLLAASQMADKLGRTVEDLPTVSLSGEDRVSGLLAVWYEYEKDYQKVYTDYFVKDNSFYIIDFSFEDDNIDRILVRSFLKNFRAL